MKVTLINHDPLEVLLFTKATRLQQAPALMEEIRGWDQERVDAELRHIANTIRSSWEFIRYTFIIEGVSRAFTHQFVRTRVGSYAQQSQRAVDMTGFDNVMPDFGRDQVLINEWEQIMDEISNGYTNLINLGADHQDARGVLPINVSTNITAAFTLRALHDMARVRLCVRTQGEYQEVFRAMRAAVLEVHPWAEPMIQVECCVTGTCAFPDFPMERCEMKPYVYDPRVGKSYAMEAGWMGQTRPGTLEELRGLHARVLPGAGDQPNVVPADAS